MASLTSYSILPVATLVVGICWALRMTNDGQALGVSLISVGGLVVVTGLFIGIIIAYGRIPAVFATLAMASVIFGFGNLFSMFLETNSRRKPSNGYSSWAMARSSAFPPMRRCGDLERPKWDLEPGL